MMRSSVDLPEPDCPSKATISPSARRKSTPSSTERAAPSASLKDLPTPLSSTMASAMGIPRTIIRSHWRSEMHPVLGQLIEPPPDEVVHAHHEHAHDADAQRNARKVADGCHVGDVAAQADRLQRGV